MKTPSPILTCQEDDLREYFSSGLPQSRFSKVTLAVQIPAELELGVGPLKFKKAKEWWHKLTERNRIHQAAWNWLRPDHPQFGATDVKSLQKAVGLEHVEIKDLISNVHDRCNEIARAHPKLSLWIRKRLSLLELCLYQHSKLPEELRDNATRGRYALIQAIGVFYAGDYQQTIALAERICRSSLHAAGQAVTLVLGQTGCPMSANLMMPVAIIDGDGPRFALNSPDADNAKIAARLWEKVASKEKQCLAIVAETKGNKHSGFWVPLDRSANGLDIPGAPTAYNGEHGSAVFKDDLPSLDWFSPSLTERWHEFLRTKLTEKLFVSLPFFMPSIGDSTSSKTVVAVLNVNADPTEEGLWSRAYHLPWLEIATEQAYQFVETAYYGAWLKNLASKGDGKVPLLGTSDSWPGLEKSPLLGLPNK